MVLTTGKALKEKLTEVRVHFRRQRDDQANTLVFSIQPNEGVELEVYARRPGYAKSYEQKSMRFDYTHDSELPDAYEQVIVDAIRSQKSLFASSDEVLRSWEILAPVQQAWQQGDCPLKMYAPGTDFRDLLQ
jgi:glucose-6-phosphate 1-dehydrogenase